jgi:hypothetical protein
MAKIEGIESPNPTIASNEFVLKRRYSWSDHGITFRDGRILHAADLHNKIRFGGDDAFSYFDNCKQKKNLH